jgi:hypothetical protein
MPVFGIFLNDEQTQKLMQMAGTQIKSELTACGQVLGYKIYANRVYLAYVTKSFSYDVIRIANLAIC